MKRFMVLVALLALLVGGAGNAFAGVSIIPAFSAVAIDASADSSSVAYDFTVNPELVGEYFGFQLTVSGSGTAKVEALVSNDGTNFMEADGASDVMSGKTAGTSFASFTIPLCRAFKLKITETGGANAIGVTGWLSMARK